MNPHRPAKKKKPGPATRWSSFKPMYDYWGHELKRFYKLETLSNATDGMLGLGDNFITQSVKSALGPFTVTSLHFELFQEGRYQLIFRLNAGNIKKGRGAFGFVVAKNQAECSDVARAEHANLGRIQPRAPESIVRVYRGGTIYLPDRHGRKEGGRTIYAYLTQWLQGFDELGVDQNLQFIVNVQRRHTFTIAETNQLKSQMIEIISRTLDAKSGTCMAMPEIASGDFVIRRGRNGGKLKLIACRKLLDKMTPAKLLSKMLNASWKWGDRRFELRPDEPEQFLAGLSRAVGPEVARAWLVQHAAARRSGKLPGRRDAYIDALEDLAAQA